MRHMSPPAPLECDEGYFFQPKKSNLEKKSAPSTTIHPPSVCVVLSILQIDVVIANKSKHQPFDKALKD